MQPLVTTRVHSHTPTSSSSDAAATNHSDSNSGHTLVLNSDFLRRVAEYHAGVSRPIGRNQEYILLARSINTLCQHPLFTHTPIDPHTY